MRSIRPASVLLTLLLCACGSDDRPAPQAAAAPTAPPTKTVVDDQLKAMEKARAVQGTVNDAKENTDEKLKDAGG